MVALLVCHAADAARDDVRLAVAVEVGHIEADQILAARGRGTLGGERAVAVVEQAVYEPAATTMSRPFFLSTSASAMSLALASTV